mmetsp:Transcript_40326/g.97337  ORF Transcript_40326/g.97337 Transcript_40326/m.97337 type:complete len:325 (-) Transcript_40326:72-1046(-)
MTDDLPERPSKMPSPAAGGSSAAACVPVSLEVVDSTGVDATNADAAATAAVKSADDPVAAAGDVSKVDNSVTSSPDRHYVVALWEPTKNPFVAKMEPSLEKLATKAEEEADEAICLEMEDDGTLTVHASKHSVPKSLLTMGIKLAIVWPLGLAGALGIAKAGVEIEAATRNRTREGLTEDELRLLMGKMKPGWCAFIATYKEVFVPAAVSACVALGAVIVWDGNGGVIERIIDETDLEEDFFEQEEGNVKVTDSFGTGTGTAAGGSGRSTLGKGGARTKTVGTTKLETPQDQGRACCSYEMSQFGKRACCLCTCIWTQIANFFL